MKLSIEIDLQPDEIPLATELFAVLHKITTNIRPKNSKKLFVDLLSRLEESGNEETIYSSIIQILQTTNNGNYQDELLEDLLSALIQVAFSTELILKDVSVQPYILLITKLPGTYRTKMREKLVPKIIQFLAASRPIESGRIELFPYAEAFAYLIKLELISSSGAMTTIINLLKHDTTKSAGITMLGKSIEIALPEFKKKCEPSYWPELERVLDQIHDESLQYDVKYAKENLSMNLTPIGPKSTNSTQANSKYSPGQSNSISSNSQLQFPVSNYSKFQGSLTFIKQVQVHKEKIFTFTYDPISNSLITSSKDGSLSIVSSQGVIEHTTQMNGYYAASLDINPNTGMVVIAGKEVDSNSSPGIIVYDLKSNDGATNLVYKDTLKRKDIKIITAVKTLHSSPQSSMFVSAESIPRQKKYQICLYHPVSSLSNLSPTTVYDDHVNLISCFAQPPEQDHIFYSGSHDHTVRIWDSRKSQCAGIFGLSEKEKSINLAPRPIGHAFPISSLDVSGNYLVSVDIKESLMIWDVRFVSTSLATTSLNSSNYLSKYPTNGAMKVLLGSSRHAILATVPGLKVMDLQSGALTSVGKTNENYSDLKWNSDQSILYASQNGIVEFYKSDQ